MTNAEIQEINRVIAEAMGLEFRIPGYKNKPGIWVKDKKWDSSQYFTPYTSISDVFEAVEKIVDIENYLRFTNCLENEINKNRRTRAPLNPRFWIFYLSPKIISLALVKHLEEQ